MSYVPDPIERGEARCDSWYYEALQPNGQVKCDCGNLFDLEDGETCSADPYAIPVCPDCFEKWVDSVS